MGIKNTRLKTRKLAVAAMLSALGVVILYLGSIINVLDLTMVALASIMIFFAVIEMGNPYPYLIYLVTGVLSMLVLPDKFAALTYLAFGGIYPIFKQMFEKLHHIIEWILKMSFFNTVLSVLIAVSVYILHIDDSDLGYSLVIYLLGNLAFVLYDIAMSRLVVLYLVKLRKRFNIQKYFEK